MLHGCGKANPHSKLYLCGKGSDLMESEEVIAQSLIHCYYVVGMWQSPRQLVCIHAYICVLVLFVTYHQLCPESQLLAVWVLQW